MFKKDVFIMPNPSIKIFRGTKKNKGPGRDLGERFRVEVPNSLVFEALVESYPDAEINEGSLLLRNINVYFYSDNIEETFSQKYVKFSENDFRYYCDKGRNICTNKEGNTRECLAKNKQANENCPEGCVRSARLFFYIKELVDDYGDYSIASIDISSIYEWHRLPARLEELKTIIGGLKTTDLPSLSGHIPFCLSREKTTIKRNFNGIKKRGDFYMIKISIDPSWHRQVRKFKQFLQLPQEIRLEALKQGVISMSGVFAIEASKELFSLSSKSEVTDISSEDEVIETEIVE